MAAGYYAISQAIQGTVADPWHFDHAAKAIGFAILFDGFDGRIARMTNTTSAFGRELDSLADVIAFGVAPAVLAWMWGFRMLPLLSDGDLRNKVVQLGAIATFIFLMAGASRLARFNIQTNPQPSNPGRPGRKYFVGMPIPAGAGVVAAVVHLVQGNPLQYWWLSIGWGVFVFAIAFLMVSTWRFYSFKEINLASRSEISDGSSSSAESSLSAGSFRSTCCSRWRWCTPSEVCWPGFPLSFAGPPRRRRARLKMRPHTPDEKRAQQTLRGPR